MVNEKTDPDICMKRGRIVFSVLFSSFLLWFSEFLLASDCTAVAENVDACEITGDSIPASRVLYDGCGQCNTKSNLFMALLRACSIECRIHGFTIHKRLQNGAMTGLVYLLAPENVFHSWVEVHLGDRWYITEGIILDSRYLSALRRKFPPHAGPFVGYGVAVKDWKDLNVDFNGNDTFIQSEGINGDYGVCDSPDDLLSDHGQEMSHLKAFVYRHIGRHLMNRNVGITRGCVDRE